MKFLITSDLHRRTVWFDWLAKNARQFDFLAIAGDVLDSLAGGSFIDRFGDTIVVSAGQISDQAHLSPNHIIFDTEHDTVLWCSEAKSPIKVSLTEISPSPDPNFFGDGPDRSVIAHRERLPR